MTATGNYPGPSSWVRANWKTGAIIILSVLITVILLRSCSHQPVTDSHASIDSLVNINQVTQHRYNELSDSVNQIILEKDKVALDLTKSLQAITAKYELIRHNRPNVDTIVKTHVVYQGSEAIEKIPILEASLDNCQSEIEDYRELVKVKTDQNNALQGQFNQAIVITSQQEKAIKKANRKAKWLKVGIVAETVVVFGGLIYLLAK